MLDLIRKSKFPKVLLCASSLLLGLQPVMTSIAYAADIEVDQAAAANQQSNMTVAPNGTVPVQNIAKPNSSGLSHNKFSNFNVNKDGLIINNSAQLTNTNLAGYIIANTNLTQGREASIILNEVTSSKRTNLNGFSEIAGKQAGLIIANPNGITCDGCGFVNTPKASLSTGVPTVNNGLLENLSINGGDISIEGEGLNATGANSVELMAQAIKINGQINAKNLQVIAGNNDIAPSARGLTSAENISSTTAGAASTTNFAIESSALGGMYADRIRLLATDAGVGVKLDGNLAANAGEMHVTADGKLMFKNQLSASGDMQLESKNAGIEFNDEFQSLHANNVEINAKQNINTHGQFSSDEKLKITTQQTLNNNADIYAGVNRAGSATQQGELTLEAGTDINNNKLLSANKAQLKTRQDIVNADTGVLKADQATLQSARDIENKGEVSANNLNIAADRDVINRGAINADTLEVTADASIKNQEATMLASQDLKITAQQLENSTSTVGSNGGLTANISDSLNNQNQSLLFSQGAMNIEADKVLNENSTLFSGDELNITGANGDAASELVNSSANIESLSDINLIVNNVTNKKSAFEQEEGRLLKGYISTNCLDCTNDHHRAEYTIKETLENTITQDSAASRILADGNLNIQSESLTNNYSHIEANGDIDIQTADLANTGAAEGIIERSTIRKTGRITDGSFNSNKPYINQYNAANTQAKLEANPGSAIATPRHITRYGIKTNKEEFTAKKVDPATIKAGGDVNIVATNGILQENGERLENVTQVAINNQNQGVNVNTVTPLPTSGLFVASASPTSNVLFETNPAFTRFQNFINSDYMLNLLGSSAINAFGDTENLLRLGDAYYEQQYVREQLMAMTGQRYLNNSFDSDQQQYIALMDNGVTQAQALNLSPGISLTPAQTAALTSDMVWLEQHDVNGKQVLVPVVYLSHLSAERLSSNGALITGENVDIITGEAGIVSSGSIKASDELQLVSLGSIENLGQISGANASLASAQDIKQSSTRHQNASIKSTGDIELYAQDDIQLEKSVTSLTAKAGKNSYRYDAAGKDSSIESGGQMNVRADNNIALKGAKLNSQGDMSLSAGADVDVASQQLERNYSMFNRKSYNKKESVSHIGSEVNSQGNLNIDAGNNAVVTGSQVNSEGDTRIVAANDIRIDASADRNYVNNYSKSKHRKSQQINEDVTHQAGVVSSGANIELLAGNDIAVNAGMVEAQNDAVLSAGNDIAFDAVKDKHYAFYYKKSSGRSGLSKTSKTKMQLTDNTQAVGGEINAQSIIAQAGNDVRFKASSAIADEDITVAANGNVDIVSDTQYSSSLEYEKTTKSGVLGTGGIGFTVGKMERSREQTQKDTRAVGSNIASLAGDINVTAQEQYNQKGSALTALKGDVNVDAKRINIESAQNTLVETDKTEYKKSGVTVGLSGQLAALESQIQSTLNTGERGQTTGDSRRDALIQGMRAYNTYDTGSSIVTGISDVTNIISASPNSAMASIFSPQAALGNVEMGVQITAGSESSSTDLRNEGISNKASTIVAGGDINLSATGDGDNSDINIKGSQLEAENVNLKADDEIALTAAANTTKLREENDNSSGSLGVKIGVGDQTGIAIIAGVSVGKGHTDSDSTQWQETLVAARNEANLSSGGDTQVKGAQVIADKVSIDVGGDFLLASLQDTAKYERETQQAGANISVCVPPICAGTTAKGSASASSSEINNEYQSVQEQSGIYAGQQGFDINVGNHTQLDGAVIASDASADKNKLSTQSLGHSNLNNFEESSASSSSYSASFSYQSAGSAQDPNAAENNAKNEKNEVSKSRFDQGNILTDNIGNLLTKDIIDEEQSSTTFSAISPATIEVRDDAETGNDSLAGLSRDTDAANNALNREFDANDAIEEVEIAEFNRQVTEEATQLGMRKVGDYFKAKTDDLVTHKATLEKEQERFGVSAERQAEIDRVDAELQTYETQRVVMHAAVAAIGAALGDGDVVSAAGGAVTGHMLAQVASTILEDSKLSDENKDLIINAVATAGGGVTGSSGAVAGSTGDAYNRQLHPLEQQWIKRNADQFLKSCQGADCPKTEKEAEYLLYRSALYDLDEDAKKAYDGYESIDKDMLQVGIDFIKANVDNVTAFTNEKGKVQSLFSLEEGQYENHNVFMPEGFKNDDYRKAINVTPQEKGFIDTYIKQPLASGVGSFTGGFNAKIEGVKETYDLLMMIANLDLDKVSGVTKEAVIYIKENPQEAMNNLMNYPAEYIDSTKKELTQFVNEGDFYDMMGMDYAKAEHYSSGLAKEGGDFYNPAKKLKAIEKISSAILPPKGVPSKSGKLDAPDVPQKSIVSSSGVKEPVKAGEVLTSKESVNRAVVGDDLTGDHIPSRASVEKAVQNELGIEGLNSVDKTWIKNNTGCVIVSGSGHCSLSQTFGGRNNAGRIDYDSKNLKSAADDNFNAMIPDLKKQGLSNAQIVIAKDRLHKLNKELIGKINERFYINIKY